MSNLKKIKFIIKVKRMSDKTETKQNNLYFTRKGMDQSIIRLGNIQTKKNKKDSNVNEFAYLLKNK